MRMVDVNRRRTDGDETWFRLIDWTKGQKPAERMSAQILQFEGFTYIDPTHPLGGKDGAKDIICLKDDIKWIGAVYFPRGQKPFREIKKKFIADYLGVEKNNAEGFVFVTNQELKSSERTQLCTQYGDKQIAIYHLDRITHILNNPANYAIRLEYLDITMSPDELISHLTEKDNSYLKMLQEIKDMMTRNSNEKENGEPHEVVIKLEQNNVAENTYEPTANNVPIPHQLYAIFKTLNDSLDANSSTTELNETVLGELDTVRLHLFSHSLMYKYYTNETLGNHVVHLLYKYKDRLELNPTERNLIFETMLSDSNDLIASWYWLNFYDSESFISVIIDLAYHNTNLRKIVFSILKKLELWIPEASLHLIKEFLTDNDKFFLKELLEYCAIWGDETIIPYLELSELHGEELATDLEKTKLSILSKPNPLDIFNQVVQSKDEHIPQIVLDNVSRVSSKISEELLIEGTFHPNITVKSLSISEIVERNLLSQNSANTIFKPKQNMEVSFDCINKLIQNNIVLSEEYITDCLELEEQDEMIFQLYRSYPLETLKEKIEYYSLHGDIAYKVLAVFHYEEVRGSIRKDIEENFQRLEQERVDYINKLILDSLNDVQDSEKPAIVRSMTDRLKGRPDENTSNFIKSRYTAAALSALSLHGTESDVFWARKLISSKYRNVKLSAVQLLEKFGDISDLEVLLEVAENSYGILLHHACRTILKIQATPDSSLIVRMINSKQHDMVSFTINHLLNCNIDVDSLLYKFLFNEKDYLRLQVLAYYVKKLTEDELKLFLIEYIDSGNYYYNVVCWLDRILYSPELLKQKYKKLLLKKIEVIESVVPSNLYKH